MCEVLKTRNDITSEQLPASEPVAACVGEVAGGALRAARYARSQAQAARPKTAGSICPKKTPVCTNKKIIKIKSEQRPMKRRQPKYVVGLCLL